MKTGRTLSELAAEIERQANAKRDLVADTTALVMTPIQNDLVVGDEPAKPINSLAHDQIGSRVGIPAKYYDRMLAESPELLATNVNHWFRANPERRMIRTLDGNVRAFLSDRYRPLENVDMAEAVLPVLLDERLQIMSCEMTERRLYIKAVHPSIQKDIPTGHAMDGRSSRIFDTLSPAIIISNSEVGSGALKIETAVWTRACTNLSIMAQRSMRKYHIGGKAGDLDEAVSELMSDHTRALTDAAVWSQVRDVVKGAFDRAKFDAMADEIAGMAERKIEGDPVKVVELGAKKLGLTDGERGSVLRHLISGGDLSQYGFFNAITRTAEDVEDYDRATDLERVGGQVIELKASEWRELARA